MPSEPAAGDRARDAGMVTAELAACLPVLVLVLGVVVTAIAVVSAGVRAQDAAREAARAVARGSAPDGLVRGVLPGAQVSTSTHGGEVVAVVRTEVHPLGGWLPSITVTERSVAAVEPQGVP